MEELSQVTERKNDSDDIAEIKELASRMFSALSVLKANARQLFIGAALGAVAGVLVSLLMQPEFRSNARLIPYRSPSTASAGLSGLAGLAGVRLSGVGLDQTVTPDLYPEVIRSLDFREDLGMERVWIPSLGRTLKVVDYLRYLADSTWRSKVINYTIGLPLQIFQNRTDLNVYKAPTEGLQPFVPKRFSVEYSKRLSDLENRVLVSYDKKTSLITISVEMPDAVVAAQVAALVSEKLRSILIKYETSKAAEQLAFLRVQMERGKERYRKAEEELARFIDSNRVLVSAISTVKRARLEREVTLSYEVLSEITRQFEQMTLKVNQDTPAFAVLESPIVEPIKHSPKRALLFLLGGVLGFFGAGAAIFARR
jgi:uncharacterized protein involved in exopolysaccharide biosynthesis